MLDDSLKFLLQRIQLRRLYLKEGSINLFYFFSKFSKDDDFDFC
jgi:hypothetical protein